jgi:hypothetical protein
VLRFPTFVCINDLKLVVDHPMLNSILKISLISVAVGIPLSALAFVALALIGF